MTHRNSLARIVIVGVAAAALSAPALAQTGGRNEPPPPLVPPKPKTVEKSPTVLWNIGVAILLTGGVLAIALIPSKRGHQD